MDDEYKGLATRLSLWAQSKHIPSGAEIITRIARRIATKRNPKLVEKFITLYGINHTQAERCSNKNTAATCASKYGTLNEFFTRKIKNITIDPGAIVSPAMCKAVVFDTFANSRVWVKGKMWSAQRLLRSSNVDLTDYAVGVFRLRPADYHRFHSPMRCVVSSIRHIHGGYLSVDPAVVQKRNVFTENNRVVVKLQSVFGTVYFVAVGAAGVGRVVIGVEEGQVLEPGELLGMFEFGGSTVVVLIPNPSGTRIWDRQLLESSAVGEETYLTVGSRVSA